MRLPISNEALFIISASLIGFPLYQYLSWRVQQARVDELRRQREQEALRRELLDEDRRRARGRQRA